ncbi:hypothetical protein ACWEOW_17295 [Monashia sp. NPDC004114]
MGAGLTSAAANAASGAATVEGNAGGLSKGGALASGSVLDGLGRPDTGAVVLAYAWPDQSALIGQKTGARIPLIRLGRAKADSSGRYTLHVAPGQLMKTAGKHGYVNVELVALSGGRDMTYDYSVKPFVSGSPSTTDSWSVMGASDGASAPRVDYDFKAQKVSRTPDSGHGSKPVRESALVGKAGGALAATADATGRGADVSATPDSVPYCSLLVGSTYYGQKEHFSTLYTMSGIPATLTEGTSSTHATTHTLGVAQTLDHVSWSASGTSSITHTSSASASTTYSTSHTIYNRVNYRDYGNSCTGLTQRTPIGFYDILSNDGVNVTRANWYTCSPKNKGDHWNTGTASEITVGAGVSLSVATVSAQSGFSDSVDLGFVYNVPGEICGNNVNGPLSSSIVEADIY